MNYGHLWQVARYKPDLVAILEDPERFELVATLPGFVPRDSRRVYRYRSQAELGQR